MGGGRVLKILLARRANCSCVARVCRVVAVGCTSFLFCVRVPIVSFCLVLLGAIVLSAGNEGACAVSVALRLLCYRESLWLVLPRDGTVSPCGRCGYAFAICVLGSE